MPTEHGNLRKFRIDYHTLTDYTDVLYSYIGHFKGRICYFPIKSSFKFFFPVSSVNAWNMFPGLKLLSSGNEGKDSPHQEL